ncbi:hypothetical protein [Bradyrhizobium sp. STM 3566]|uniref:HNH endonuclease n=1 Tax=Bradyrhizobium sp. STM 3566 TaxID=578928 RepID=UPI00389104DD
MDHYVAYHKTDERGPYFQDAKSRQDRQLRFSTKNKLRDDALVGSRLWVFTGAGSPRVYELSCSGIIKKIERGVENEVVFDIDYFPDPIDVTKVGWFQQLMTSHANFARGLSKIGDANVVAALEAIRAADEARRVDKRSAERLSAEAFDAVSAEHVWNALEKLRQPDFEHSYGPSTDYDLVTDLGERFPPKAVFGIAATEALGFRVLPKHFSGGIGTICFRILERSGYAIVLKGETSEPIDLPPSSEDCSWAEGKPHLVSHLRRERAWGLAQAKRDWFIRKHGRLFCERCGMDPILVYAGDHGAACIEVHHQTVQVKDMARSHKTRLEDLECLCANCHRVEHRLLKLAAKD